ncbi:MAG: hypothetical protein NTY55_02040 [Flavobacteriia bacterium]|nr:hypothetical protein [Flavobacteriia bacterium]
MKKTKNYLFLSIAVIISLAITSCGKYEDGPGFSFLEFDGDASTLKIRRLTNKELWVEEPAGLELAKFEAQ